MISGALCPTHGSSNLHFIQVTAPDNDVVNEVPVFGPGMHGVGYKTPSSYLDPEQDMGYKTPSSHLDPEQDVEYYGGRYKAAFASGPRAGCGILWCGI